MLIVILLVDIFNCKWKKPGFKTPASNSSQNEILILVTGTRKALNYFFTSLSDASVSRHISQSSITATRV